MHPCWSAPVPERVLAVYAGDYSGNCGDPASLRARISKEGLTLLRGSRSITGTFEGEDPSYLGASPPAAYATALKGQAGGVGSIVFVMYRYPSGPAVDIEADPAVLQRVGIQRKTIRYKRC